MKIAFGHMHLPSEVFWHYSLREWQAAFKGYVQKHNGSQGVDTPLDRSDLNSLMERYPDDGPRETD